MSRRGIVNTLVALVAILITSGLAAQAVVRGPSARSDSELVAAGVDGRDSVAVESPGVTAASRATASTQPRPLPRLATTTLPAQAPVTTLTTVPVPPETTIPPVTAAPIPPPTPLPTVTRPPVAPPPPPATVQTGPGSWRIEANGVTVTASIEPAAPRVGDTVTVSYTTEGEGDFCCWGFVYVAGALVGQNDMPQGGPCPIEPLTTGSATFEVAGPAPFTLQVQGSRIDPLCVGPPTFHTANLVATVDVLPALPAA
jgi:hypothetical protein